MSHMIEDRVVKRLLAVIILFAMTMLVGCKQSSQMAQAQYPSTASDLEITIYKSPTCGCCRKWVNHVEESGFISKIEHPKNLENIKDELAVPTAYRSCHTAVTKNGYIFEGHIPAKYIKNFLKSPSENAKGLTVPAMPVGSPGMEVGQKFMPYTIYQLNTDGSTEVFAQVASLSEQF